MKNKYSIYYTQAPYILNITTIAQYKGFGVKSSTFIIQQNINDEDSVIAELINTKNKTPSKYIDYLALIDVIYDL